MASLGSTDFFGLALHGPKPYAVHVFRQRQSWLCAPARAADDMKLLLSSTRRHAIGV